MKGAALAGRLDQMLQPGERVAYRATTPWTDNIPVSLGSLTGITIVAAVIWLIDPDTKWLLEMAILFAATMLSGNLIFWLLLGHATAIVTDRRVIHASGIIRPRVVEMPVERIAALDETPDRLTLIDDSGETLDLNPAPRAKELAAAIAAQAGLSASMEAADGA